jgi:two-component system phosphate regulon sensor histidine kinase PhoR
MKLDKPKYFLILVCLTYTLVGFAILWVSTYLELRLVFSMLLIVLSGCLLFLSLTIGIRRFVEFRLYNIFKTVQTPPKLKGKKLTALLTESEDYVDQIASMKQEEIKSLKSQNDFRREFIGNLSHELKTPAFSIQGYIETLIDGACEDPKMCENFLERAKRASDRMIQLLEDLDNLTRLENPELTIDIRPFNLVELIQETFESLDWMAKEKNIHLMLGDEYEPLMVMGDKKRISQVLVNLTKNSILYGVQDGQTKISATAIEDFLLIEVKDNGIGIDPKHWQRLFERFYRVEQSRNRHEGGTGLGLAIVKHILELHEQTITMRSTVGEGSTFSFCLPKADKSITLSSKGVPIK